MEAIDARNLGSEDAEEFTAQGFVPDETGDYEPGMDSVASSIGRVDAFARLGIAEDEIDDEAGLLTEAAQDALDAYNEGWASVMETAHAAAWESMVARETSRGWAVVYDGRREWLPYDGEDIRSADEAIAACKSGREGEWRDR